MNILIAVNEKYIRQSKLMLYSLSKYVTKEDINIYLLYDHISDVTLQKFKKYVETKCSGKLYAIRVDKMLVEKLPLMEHYTSEIYFRLLAGELLPNEVKRVLWLDSDIIIKGEIEEFYNTDFEGNYLVACEDLLVNNNQIEKFITIDKESRIKYFNSGVILFDLDKIRQDNKQEELFKFMRNNANKLEMPDQDALNVIFYGKVKLMNPIKYNHLMLTVEKVDKKKKELLKKETSVIHYVGADKPWYYKYVNQSWKYYWKMELENGNFGKFFCFVIKHYSYLFARKLYYRIKG